MTETKTNFKFRILQGKHQDGSGENVRTYGAKVRGKATMDRDGNPLADIIETDSNLVELFGSDKFERLTN